MTKSVNSKYVSRAGDKLASVSSKLGLDFRGKTVLDVGSSTGGFTDYSLQNGAAEVYGVDTGTKQMSPVLMQNPKLKLYEKTDIRDFVDYDDLPEFGLILIDVSFISLKDILPSLKKVCSSETQIVAMVKPQFEAKSHQKAKGIIKNDTIRRAILKDFEEWVKRGFVLVDKADSDISGLKGNRERFYLLSNKY